MLWLVSLLATAESPTVGFVLCWTSRTYLDGCHSVPACFQNHPYTARCYSLSQTTDHSTSDQNILHHLPNRIYSGAIRISRKTLSTNANRCSPSILVERPRIGKSRPLHKSRKALRDCPPELGMLRPIACCGLTVGPQRFAGSSCNVTRSSLCVQRALMWLMGLPSMSARGGSP